jgi:hypothetical protein
MEVSIMNESILTSIKKMLGISEEYEQFDADLIMHINSVFSILTQLGVGPTNGFMIEDKTSTWNQFIGNDAKFVLVKSYMYLKVKLMFDPPLSSSVMESYKVQISEYEWRLNIFAENEDSSEDEPETYTGSYNITPKAFEAQTLDTSGKIMDEDLVVNEVPFYETSNDAGGVTTYIAKEADSK